MASANPDPLTVRQGYDAWAADYDDADPSTLLDEPIVRRLTADWAGRRVLDSGCGTGRYAAIAAGAGAQPVGLDLSWAMLERARQRAPHRPWVQGQVTALPFAEGAFDGVLCGLVVDHVPDLPAFFGQAARVLRPGGRLVMSAIHPAMQRLTGRDVHAAGRVRIPGCTHRLGELTEHASGAGLCLRFAAEPRVTGAIVERRPGWRDRLGRPALLVLEWERAGRLPQ